jgi:hypothetical protein
VVDGKDNTYLSPSPPLIPLHASPILFTTRDGRSVSGYMYIPMENETRISWLMKTGIRLTPLSMNLLFKSPRNP